MQIDTLNAHTSCSISALDIMKLRMFSLQWISKYSSRVVWSEAGALQSASYIQGKSIVKEALAILIELPESVKYEDEI